MRLASWEPVELMECEEKALKRLEKRRLKFLVGRRVGESTMEAGSEQSGAPGRRVGGGVWGRDSSSEGSSSSTIMAMDCGTSKSALIRRECRRGCGSVRSWADREPGRGWVGVTISNVTDPSGIGADIMMLFLKLFCL